MQKQLLAFALVTVFAGLVLVFHESAAECHWVGNARNRRLWVACARNDEGAEVENATQHALRDLEAFYLQQIEFHRLAANESKLCNYALIGECQFCRDVLQVDQQPDHQTCTVEKQQEKTKNDGWQLCPDAELGFVDDFFVADECALHVTGHETSPSFCEAWDHS